jgi:quercetin dioxygenase-like cupin family protein
MESEVFEIWEDPAKKFRFCFSHSDNELTTGVLIMQPGAELPKHQRNTAFENLMQIRGRCKMTLLSDSGETQKERILEHPQNIRFEKGQWHIHANPFDEVSVTLFKAEGDITSIVQTVRETFTRIVVPKFSSLPARDGENMS